MIRISSDGSGVICTNPSVINRHAGTTIERARPTGGPGILEKQIANCQTAIKVKIRASMIANAHG
jgi:hypothetical protein